MVKEIKFTKVQREALKKIFEDANKSFNEVLAEKPYFYHEYDRSVFISGFIKSGINFIIDEGYCYLEK